MNSFDATTKILENLKEKYKLLDNIMVMTKELDKAVDSGDGVSLDLVLKMRGNIMQKVDLLDRENKTLAQKLPQPLRSRIEGCISHKTNGTMSLDNPLETNIYDTSSRSAKLLGKIIELDKSINERLKKPKRKRGGSWNA